MNSITLTISIISLLSFVLGIFCTRWVMFIKKYNNIQPFKWILLAVIFEISCILTIGSISSFSNIFYMQENNYLNYLKEDKKILYQDQDPFYKDNYFIFDGPHGIVAENLH